MQRERRVQRRNYRISRIALVQDQEPNGSAQTVLGGNRNGCGVGSAIAGLRLQVMRRYFDHAKSHATIFRRAFEYWPYLFIAISLSGLTYIAIHASR